MFIKIDDPVLVEGAVSTGVLLGSSASVYLMAFSLYRHVHSAGLLLGLAMSLIGAVTFFCRDILSEQPLTLPGRLVRIVAVVLAGVFTVYLAAVSPRAMVVASWSAPASAPSLLQQLTLPSHNATCQRKPLQSLSYWPGERKYHAFDNVLLIVFFSHARYDANLDYYQEVYSEFFPNVRAKALQPESS
ncbi:hypothetical protein EIP86_008653 [Pleurotus ostreatoroseus]|nr:hypothetical protein EIP86_008653 [Pleurotus ostreatoroseus]